MPLQSIISDTNTVNFFRQSINGLAANINYAIANSFATLGNIVINRSNSLATALFVANGSIKGNGSSLFSLNAESLFGVANNSQLQNNSLNVMTTLGISGGANGISLGGSITLAVSVNNSISNTSISIPTSANSVPWAMQLANTDAANASIITTVIDETRGGTGESIYTTGNVLIGNTLSGKLDKSSIASGGGVAITLGNGSISIAANLFQGSGILLSSSSGNSGITIVSNAYMSGTLSTEGLIQLYDDYDSTSLTRVPTANAVNAVAFRITNTPPSQNAYGRLIDRKIYITANQSGLEAFGIQNGTSYTWPVPGNTSYIKVLVVGGGGAGANSPNTISDSTTYKLSTSGGAGHFSWWEGPASVFGSTVELHVGGGGVSSGSNTYNRKGATSYFGSSIIASPGGAGGILITSSNNIFTNTSVQYYSGGLIANDTFTNPNFYQPGFSESPEYSEKAFFMMDPSGANTEFAYAGTGGSTPYGRGGIGGVIYDIPIPFNLSGASDMNRNLTFNYSNPAGIFLSPDGVNLYVANSDPGFNDITQYTLSTPWNILTATYSKFYDVQSVIHEINSLFISPDGLNLYITDTNTSTANDIFQHTLNTAWDISSAFYSGKSISTTIAPFSAGHRKQLSLSPDGLNLYIVDQVDIMIYQYTLNTAWDITTANSVANKTFSLGPTHRDPQGLFFTTDGLKVFVADSDTTSSNSVSQYTLNTAWDITTASFSKGLDVEKVSVGPQNISISTNGLNLYLVFEGGALDGGIYQYTLGGNSGWAAGESGKGYGSGGGGCIVGAEANTFPGTNPNGFVLGGNGAPGIVIVEAYTNK